MKEWLKAEKTTTSPSASAGTWAADWGPEGPGGLPWPSLELGSRRPKQRNLTKRNLAQAGLGVCLDTVEIGYYILKPFFPLSCIMNMILVGSECLAYPTLACLPTSTISSHSFLPAV